MRILHINASYKPAWIYGGPTVSVSMLCEALATKGVDIDVFTTTANGISELNVIPNKPVTIDGVNVIYFKRITKGHTHFSPALLLKLWKTANQYDVIHIHAWWNTVSVLSCLIALKKKIPVLVSPRGMLSDYSFVYQNAGKKGLIHRLLGKRLLKKAFIHVTAQSEKLEIEKVVQSKGIFVLPNIIQLSSASVLGHTKDETFRLIFLSRIDPKKGLDVLIDALAQVNNKWQLTVAGAGDESYIELLKTKAQDLGVSEKISWVGFAGDEKFNLIGQHDLFVLPSHNENFGNAVIESLSVGTAVLVSDSVGLADYVRKNNLGWASAALPAPLAQAINDIIANRLEDLNRIRRESPQIIKQDFDPSILAQRYIDLYQQITANERV